MKRHRGLCIGLQCLYCESSDCNFSIQIFQYITLLGLQFRLNYLGLNSVDVLFKLSFDFGCTPRLLSIPIDQQHSQPKSFKGSVPNDG